jgi:glycerate kinase
MAAGIRPGAELIADEVGLPGAIGEADLVLTGEGRLDAQTGLGKGAAWVAHLADRANRPVLAICGRIDLDAAGMHALGFAAWADCVSQAVDDARAMREAPRLIAEATRMLLESWGQAASP